jgi:hypothetical protein
MARKRDGARPQAKYEGCKSVKMLLLSVIYTVCREKAMKISARGWSRDMGENVIAEFSLADIAVSQDPQRYVWREKQGIFERFGTTFIAWSQKLRLMGEYRMEIELSSEDVLHLFKSRYGTELGPWHLDYGGFTVSPELAKRLLRTVKLSEVTLGDLAAMHAASPDQPATADKLIERAKVTPFKRRI